MSAAANNTPIHRHKGTAKEHLAGIKASQIWVQELMAAHLLDTQQPIRDLPVTPISQIPAP